MQQQFKDDLKAAWQQSLPTLKGLAIKICCAVGAMMWGYIMLYLLFTTFWVGMLQAAITVAGVMVLINYLNIVSVRRENAEYEARAAERAKRRGW
jgi:hypothetical protein